MKRYVTKSQLLTPVLIVIMGLSGCAQNQAEPLVTMTEGIDASAGGGPAYIVTTPSAIYYLDKEGGGLSSMLDKDGVDWLGFHNAKGSGHKGEYRGFPNAVHKQDGNYFHAMNSGTDPSTPVIEIERDDHIRITFTSENGQWEGQYDVFPDRFDFTMRKVSTGYKYWVQYEGVPGGQMDDTDYWYASGDPVRYSIRDDREGDLSVPEWMAFGDPNSPRVLYMLNHKNDAHPDDYANRPDMTVFAFGRRGKEKYLTSPQTFSIGFIESTDYSGINEAIEKLSKE